ncbi:helix-turn-helix transcriptional regulator [Stappia stellulata]|uniref:helix-turn-helix transcriptional regulator n=1 Tax=Stappia stellulata TaxID=71235 RepID=UPI001CD3AFE6|nr:helix-turn-helix transcriptional regulator [Stappia stellulata]MCA1243748.1 helix-turn-helix transcriptional regulator [Stappia stellulata]
MIEGTDVSSISSMAVLFRILDTQARAAFVLDRLAKVAAQNEFALHLRQTEKLFTPCERSGDRLEFVNPLAQRGFSGALAAVFDPTGSAKRPRDLTLANSPRPLFAELHPVTLPPAGARATPGRQTGAVLILTLLDTVPAALEPRLRMVFSLTERETAVAASLASPRTEAEIADGLNISANTLRTHRKTIYAKLGVASRAEFATLMARLV